MEVGQASSVYAVLFAPILRLFLNIVALIASFCAEISLGIGELVCFQPPRLVFALEGRAYGDESWTCVAMLQGNSVEALHQHDGQPSSDR